MNRKTVAVIGAGVSGLTAAYALAKKGFRPVVLEKAPEVGGLSATFRYKDASLDYGPHNFHTRIPGVYDFVSSELGVQMNQLQVTSSLLYFMGRFISYPITISSAIRGLDAGTAFSCFLDYVRTRVRGRMGRDESGEDSFKAWVVDHFGAKLYDIYFGPYVKKVWGLPGEELDLVVAKKRIPEPSLFSLLVRTLTSIRIGAGHSEDISRIKSYYPPKGIGAISEKLRDAVVAAGGSVETGVEVLSVSTSGRTLKYAKDGKETRLAWDFLVNTSPITDFVERLEDPGREMLLAEASQLSYRSIILLYMFLSVEKVFDAPWVYFNERDNPELIFNRAYEIGGFSREMVGRGKSALCLEITCRKGDATWSSGDAALFDKCAAYMASHRFLDRKAVDEYMTKRLETAYPVFSKGFGRRVSRIVDYFLDRDAGVYFIGRQGLYTYANMDHCIDMGLKIAELLSGPGRSRAEFHSAYKDYLDF